MVSICSSILVSLSFIRGKMASFLSMLSANQINTASQDTCFTYFVLQQRLSKTCLQLQMAFPLPDKSAVKYPLSLFCCQFVLWFICILSLHIDLHLCFFFTCSTFCLLLLPHLHTFRPSLYFCIASFDLCVVSCCDLCLQIYKQM